MACLSFAGPVPAAPSTEQAVAIFARAVGSLPCTARVDAIAIGDGLVASGETMTAPEYVDQSYQSPDGAELTVSRERTPLGPQFAAILNVPGTDRTYAKAVQSGLETRLDLGPARPWTNLVSGSGYSWAVTLPGGAGQIVLRQTEDPNATVLIGQMDPIRPGQRIDC